MSTTTTTSPTRTSLVLKKWNGRGFARACKPDDGPEALRRTPSFVPAHIANGHRSDGRTIWREPDRVHTRSEIFTPLRGRVNELRELPPINIAELDAIDFERAAIYARLAELNAEEQTILQDGYLRGKPVTVATLKEWRELKMTAKTEAAEGGAK